MTVSDVRPAAGLATAPHLSQRVRTGLVLCIVLGVLTIPGAFLPVGNSKGGPPAPVLVLDVILGALAVWGAVQFWRTGRRLPLRIAAAAQILNVVTALPAFFVGVDAWVKILVAIVTLATLTAIVLMLSRPRSEGLD